MPKLSSQLFVGASALSCCRPIADDESGADAGATRISRTRLADDPAVGKLELVLLTSDPGSLPTFDDGGYADRSRRRAPAHGLAPRTAGLAGSDSAQRHRGPTPSR